MIRNTNVYPVFHLRIFVINGNRAYDAVRNESSLSLGGTGVVDLQTTVLGPTHPDVKHSTKLLAQVQSIQTLQVEATAVFRAIDTDSSGSISMSELTSRLADFGLTDESVEVVAVQLMTVMDADGDGEINESEWLDAYPAWQKVQGQIDGLSSRQ